MRRHLGILLVVAILVAGLLLLRYGVQVEPAGEAAVEPAPRPAPEEGHVPSAVDVPEEPPGTEVPAYPTGASDAPVVSGFTYLRHETFSCGGQTNTVAIYRSEAFARAVGLKDAETAVDCEFVLVPSGTFMMGSPEDEEGRLASNGPLHEVIVASFLMGRTELTLRVWMALGGCPDPYGLMGRSDDALIPTRHATWHESRELLTRKGLRLPSEAEWEYSCRAGTDTRFCTGEDLASVLPHAWCKENAQGVVQPVAKLDPNAFGLFDVHGNVLEWCEDIWHSTYDDAPADGSAWVLPSEGAHPLTSVGGEDLTLGVCRGGDASLNAKRCRSSSRIRGPRGISNAIWSGFRPARSLHE